MNLLHIKDWVEISKAPERKELRFFIFKSKNGEIDEILNIVTNYLTNGNKEPVLVNVSSINVGFEFYISLFHVMKDLGLLLIDDSKPNTCFNRRIAFVHSGVSDERKKFVVDDLSSEDPKIRVVIGTSALELT